MSDISRSEIGVRSAGWRRAADRGDLPAMVAMAAMFTEDARGGNSVLGTAEGRDAIIGFGLPGAAAPGFE